MARQRLRDWMHRYNVEGLAGLSNKRPPGTVSKLTAAIGDGGVENSVEE